MLGMTKIELLNDIQLLLVVSGVIILGIWFLRSLLGKGALADSQPRRNNMHPVVPLLMMLAYVLLSTFTATTVQAVLKLKEESWQFRL